MAKHQTEFFGHFFYSLDLSYDELLIFEDRLKEIVQEILEGEEAEFVHFEAEGDSLMVQCVFTRFAESLFHSICSALAGHMKDHVEAKVLFVDKALGHVFLYTLSDQKWQEAALTLPDAGPIEKALKQESERR